MDVLGPFPELDDHEYRVIELSNGIRALLISSEKKDSMLRRATSHMDVDDRKAIARLLRDPSITSVTKEIPKQRRSTLLVDNGSARNLLRKSQKDIGSSRRSIVEPGVEDNGQLYMSRGRISQRSTGDPASRSMRTSQRFGVEEASKRTSRKIGEATSTFEDDVEDRVSVRSYPSHRSIPGGNSFRKHKSQRLSSTVSLALQPSSTRQQSRLGDGALSITDMAAVAVCVSVGSLSDPEDCQGLAHVVEHMVFMGNEIHPSENDWDTFISSAGGDSNATTEAERTTFHFSVPQESFEESLSRFSQFFQNPLLKKESLQRELAAIDSEFNDSAGEVSFRLAEVACATACKGPFSHFACGNSKTLKANPKLHSYVGEFFRKHYVAGNIYAVLYSSDSLGDMEDMCRRYFQTIPQHRSPDADESKTEISLPPKFCPVTPPYKTAGDEPLSADQLGVDGTCLGSIVICDPEGAQPHTLQLTWQIPSQRKNWKSKPLMYLSYAIGSETEGSILHELKEKGWANALFVSDGTYASGLEGNAISTLFSVYVMLTDQGLLHWESVVATVYEYLGMLNREGVQFWFYEEIRKCQIASFTLKRASDPGAMVETLCQRLCSEIQQIPPERVCNGEDLLFEWDPEAVHAVLKLLVAETCRLDLITRASELASAASGGVNGGEESSSGKWTRDRTKEEPQGAASLGGIADVWLARRIKKRIFDVLLKDAVIRIEPWYRTKYCVVPCPRKTISKWRSSLMAPTSRGSFASLPARNEYVSEDFLIKSCDSTPIKNIIRGRSTSKADEEDVVEYQSRPAKVEAKCDSGGLLLLSLQTGDSRTGTRMWTRRDFVSTDSMIVSVSPHFREQAGGEGLGTDSEMEEKSKENDILGDLGLFLTSPFSETVANTPVFLHSSIAKQPSAMDHRVYLWHLQSSSFSTCRMSLTLIFKFPPASVALTSLTAVLIDLLVICFEDAVAEEKYPAFLSGTVLETCAEENGVRMVFSGFPHTVPLLVERTLPVFLGCASTGIKQLRNLSLESQVEVLTTRLLNDDCSVKDTLDGVLRLDTHHPLSKLAVLEQTQNIRSRLDSFARTALGNCVVVGLVYGNVQLQEAVREREKLVRVMQQTMPISTSTLKASAVFENLGDYFPPKRVLNLPPQKSNVLSDPRDSSALMGTTSVFIAPVPSSSVLVYFQVLFEQSSSSGTSSIPHSSSVAATSSSSPPHMTRGEGLLETTNKDLKVMAQLMAQLLKEPLFNTLRTKWLIAYHAHASVHRCEASQGITVELSSHHTGTVDLIEIIDEFFLVFFDTVLKPMTPVDFSRHVRALQLRKLEKDASPSEEAERHFETIIRSLETGDGNFDWNADVHETMRLRMITKSHLVDFFQKYLHPASPERRKLSLLIVGESEMAQASSPSPRIGGKSVRFGGRGTSQRSIGGNVVSEEGEEEVEEESKTSTSSFLPAVEVPKAAVSEHDPFAYVDPVAVVTATTATVKPQQGQSGRSKPWWPAKLLKKLVTMT